MNLHLSIDGVFEDTFPLIDANDPFNAAAERTAFDRAYEAKSSDPDAVVSIVIDLGEDDPSVITDDDLVFVADSLSLLADLDEGENTDSERLRDLAERLRPALVP
jgi:hypothetical protein